MHVSDELIAPRLRVMQIIAGALIAGVVIFLALVGALIMSGQRFAGFGNANANALPVMSILPFVLLASCAVAMVVVRRSMETAGLQQVARVDAQSDLVQLLGIKQTIMIVTLALFEGPAFFGCIALLLERELYVIAVPLIALVGMALNFPTRNSVRDWLEASARRVLEIRATRS